MIHWYGLSVSQFNHLLVSRCDNKRLTIRYYRFLDNFNWPNLLTVFSRNECQCDLLVPDANLKIPKAVWGVKYLHLLDSLSFRFCAYGQLVVKVGGGAGGGLLLRDVLTALSHPILVACGGSIWSWWQYLSSSWLRTFRHCLLLPICIENQSLIPCILHMLL